MSSHKRHLGPRLTATALALAVLGGCQSSNKDGVSPIVQVDDGGASMTPAQRDRDYYAAYEAGERLASQGQYGEALGAFEQAVKLRPASTEAMFNLGACHEAIGDPLRAISFYRRVLNVSPNDPDCYANIGTSYIKMYYRERSPAWKKMARDAWRKSLEISPDQPDVKNFLAQSEEAD